MPSCLSSLRAHDTMSKRVSTHAAADDLARECPDTAKAADKIHADMLLMRELLLEAVGPEGDKLSTHLPTNVPQVAIDAEFSPANQVAGAPRLPAACEHLLKDVEKMDVAELDQIASKVESMPPETLLSSAQLFGELMCQANLAMAQQTVRSWKANLRGDVGYVVDRSAGAVVGLPTFRSAFDTLIEKCDARRDSNGRGPVHESYPTIMHTPLTPPRSRHDPIPPPVAGATRPRRSASRSSTRTSSWCSRRTRRRRSGARS